MLWQTPRLTRSRHLLQLAACSMTMTQLAPAGATLDLDLLAYFASSNKAFIMEVAERTAADKKGGHLCKRKSDGRLMLRESAMCPDDDKAAFEDVGK